MLKNLKLGTQFTLLLTIVFFVGIVLSSLIFWRTIQHEAEADIANKAEILMQTMNSVRSYTDNYVSPIFKDQLTASPFVRESVPAFAAREVFERFRDRPEYHGFFYKEASPNPTNTRDQADDFETQIIQQFQIQTDLTDLSDYRVVNGKTLFYVARPLVMKQSSCLQCHGNPMSAPKSLIKTYGNQNGFGWKLNEVIAAQILYIPADEVFEHRQRYLTLIMMIFGSVFLIALLLLNGLLKRRVIQPIKQLTAIARQVSAGQITTQQIEAFDSPDLMQVAQRSDEPGQLARTFQRMAHEVSEREQNLNQAVEDRTAQLAETTKDAQKAKAEAEKANDAKSQFLAHMSHELRTPLNVILGFTQLMIRNGSLGNKQQEYLDMISRSGEHLLALINNVLDLSKIEAGQTTLKESRCDFYELLNSLYQMLRLKAESKGLQLIFQQPDHLPHYIYTDEGKLRQVLLNLIGNAIKFTDRGRVTLQVGVKKFDPLDSERLTLDFEVKDTGLGIEKSELEHLFEPFVQAEAGRNSHEGTGLGLPISQEFVRLLGGEMTVYSQVGVGTIFQFEIQTRALASKELPALSHNHQVIGLESGQQSYRILIVDDKLENRWLLVDLIAPIGFEVREAVDGQEAIDLWQKWSPHLIWMDVRMPVMDGLSATKQIKASANSSTVIIALMGSGFEEDRMIAYAAGCDGFMRKPLNTEMIFETMSVHLGVRYRYSTKQWSEKPSSSSSLLPLKASDLSVMPTQWVEQLHQAAARVNAKQIINLLEEIPPSHVALKDALTDLIEGFCFEEIVALSQNKSGINGR
jgi:signal transduction histidine kinase/CheY-like chemotaxis protein